MSEQNFTFAPGSVGGAAVPGEGHWHIYVDDLYVDYSATGTVDLVGVSPGNHILRAELVNNDHSVLSPRVYDELSVEVAP